MSWSTLADIKRENREAAEARERAPLIECPRCGWPLQVRGNVRNCPTGDFRTGG
jgi:hypothetical protein